MKKDNYSDEAFYKKIRAIFDRMNPYQANRMINFKLIYDKEREEAIFQAIQKRFKGQFVRMNLYADEPEYSNAVGLR